MPAPRTDKSERTAIVSWDGQAIKVKYVQLTMAEDRECRDSATTVDDKGGSFRPFAYLEQKMKRMVREIDGEHITRSSPVWNEMPDGFGDVLRTALFPQEERFFRGDAEGAEGKPDE